MPVHETEPKRRRRRKKPGDLASLQAVLWMALTEIEELLEDPDPATVIRAGHALGTLAGTYIKCLEQADVTARIARIEELLAAQQGPRPVKGHGTWAA